MRFFSLVGNQQKWPGSFTGRRQQQQKAGGLPEIYPYWVDETMKIGGHLLIYSDLR